MTPQGKKGRQGAAPAPSPSLPGSSFHHLLVDLLRWNNQDHFEAFGAFDELVRRRCDPAFLLFKLAILAGAPRDDTWEGLTGFADSRALKTTLKRLSDCADDVEKLLGGAIGRSLFQAPSDSVLPATLRGLADRYGRAVRAIKPRTKLVGRTARALIVRHVKDRTHSYLDELVACILSPLGSCTAVVQCQWRDDNADLIALLRYERKESPSKKVRIPKRLKSPPRSRAPRAQDH